MSDRPLSKLKGIDRQFAIENAARALKEFARIKRDKDLLKAARVELKRELADTKKAMTI